MFKICQHIIIMDLSSFQIKQKLLQSVLDNTDVLIYKSKYKKNIEKYCIIIMVWYNGTYILNQIIL